MKTTFADLDESAFKTYVESLLAKSGTGIRRRNVVSYLQQVYNTDAEAFATERTAHRLKRKQQRERRGVIESSIKSQNFDYARSQEIFETDALTDAELSTEVQADDAECYLKDSDRTLDLTVTGDRVLLNGEGNGLSARESKLANTAKITGVLRIEGNDCHIKGVDFQSTGEKAITFGAGVQNLTLENCRFTAPSGNADSKWFYGENFGGDLTITNCRVESFTSWYLADFSSTSGEPQQALDRVRIKRNYFRNNHGSMAARGKTGDRTKLVQFNNNKWETDTLHASFWDVFEANGTKKVEIQNNELVAPVGQEQVIGKQGAFQVWQKTTQSKRPWVISYSGNKVSNLKVGVKIAHNSGFRSPDTDSDNYLIDLTEVQTNVTYPASFKYKNADGSTASANKWLPAGNGSYVPDNADQYASPPPVVNPNGYSIVN